MPESTEINPSNLIKDLVREHPFTVILLAVLAITTGLWTLIMGYHNLVVESKNATIEANASIVQNKNATIETLNAALERGKETIANLQERLSAKDEQLVSKDKQLADYRSRALVIKASQTGLSTLSNKGLRERAMQLVDGVKSLIAKYQMEETKITYEDRSNMDKYMQEYASLSTELMNAYNQQYKVPAIVLRDELLSRLSSVKVKRDPSADASYEYPTNPLGVAMVADDLEKLARILPGD